MRQTNDLSTLSLPGRQAKVTVPSPVPQARLLAYLCGLPSLAFSDKGRATICQRFAVNDDELTAAVAALEARPGQPTPELLRTIRATVGHRTSGGEGLC